MQIYALKMHNFFRFREQDNSIVFDLTDSHKKLLETGEATIDDIYDSVVKNPVRHIENVKQDNCMVNLAGIAGVLGNNFDRSNGVGKSTVMEAICYGLYDHIVRKNVNTEKTSTASISVVTRINGVIPKDVTECFVEIIFEEQGRIYRLKRIRRFNKSHKSHSPDIEFECINAEEKESEASHRTANTNEAILEAINMDYEVFVNSVMFGQNDAGQFLTGTDKTRKEMIVRLLHLENVVGGCLEVVRDRKNKKDKEIDKLRAQIDIVRQNLEGRQSKDDMENQIKILEQQIVVAAQKSDDNFKKIGELENSNILKRSNDLMQEEVKLKNEVAQKGDQKNSQVAEWCRLAAEMKSKISSQQNRIKKGEVKTTELKQAVVNFQNDIASFDMDVRKKDLARVEKAKMMKPQFYERMEIVKKEREDNVISVTKLRANIERLEEEMKPLREQLKGAVDGTFICETCKSKVTREHIESILTVLNEDHIKIQASIEKVESLVKELTDKMANGNGKLDQINGWLIKEGVINTEIQAFEHKKKRIEDFKRQSKDADMLLKEIQADVVNMERQQKEYQEKIISISKQYDDEIKKILEEVDKIVEERIKVGNDAAQVLIEIQKLKDQNEQISKGKAECNSKIGSFKKDIENLISDQKKVLLLESQMAEEIKILNRLIVLDDVYGLEGIQTRIVKKYLPLLNIFVKDFLDTLSGGEMAIKLFVNDKSKIDLEIRGNSGEVFNMLSGGEKELSRLSVAIGLALLSFSRSSSKPEIICLDEIFGSLDDDRIKAVFRLLNKLKDKFSRVLVISHDAEINEMLEHHILIEKVPGDNGMSRVKEII